MSLQLIFLCDFEYWAIDKLTKNTTEQNSNSVTIFAKECKTFNF
jgi:hypothetical protein